MSNADHMWDYKDPYKWMEKIRTGLSGLPPLIVTCAITGGVQGKEMNENLRPRKSRRSRPMTPTRPGAASCTFTRGTLNAGGSPRATRTTTGRSTASSARSARTSSTTTPRAEDNLHYGKGRKFKSNAEAVDRVVRIAKEMGREIATPQQAREMIGISQTPSKY